MSNAPINDGGCAFPVNAANLGSAGAYQPDPGMTLRDRIKFDDKRDDDLLFPFHCHLSNAQDAGKLDWYHDAAVAAINRGHFHAIPTRDGKNLYMLRCWLNTPGILSDPNKIDGNALDSSDSTLLHYFSQGDDDESLHDHPWDFRTEILAGGYEEHLPPDGWTPTRIIEGKVVSSPGPAWDVNIVHRSFGDLIEHKAEDLHCVGKVQPGTWTLVTTRNKRRRWGFHPPGRPYILWADYLSERKQVLA